LQFGRLPNWRPGATWLRLSIARLVDQPLFKAGDKKETQLSSLGGAIVAMAAMALTSSAVAGPAACGKRVNNTHAKLLECVTVERVRAHQAAFQTHADANNGIRTYGQTRQGQLPQAGVGAGAGVLGLAPAAVIAG